MSTAADLPKILVVEDEPTLRSVYNMVLSTGPYEVDIAGNGKEALEKCAQKAYNLILLDLMMPVMDGVEFLQSYSLSDGVSPAKVILLSNLSSGKELTQAMNLGARRHILKSDLSPSQLLELVRNEVKV